MGQENATYWWQCKHCGAFHFQFMYRAAWLHPLSLIPMEATSEEELRRNMDGELAQAVKRKNERDTAGRRADELVPS